MIKLKDLSIIALLFLSIGFAFNVYADDEEVVEIQGHPKYLSDTDEMTGFFASVGPALGFETNVLKVVGGGMTSQLGYRLNKRLSLLFQADLYYTRDQKVDYVMFPTAPTLKIHFDNNFFTYVGGGYTYMWASGGNKFKQAAATNARSYNGWNILSGAGYDIRWTETIYISPQVGLIYSRIAARNWVIPLARINLNWFF